MTGKPFSVQDKISRLGDRREHIVALDRVTFFATHKHILGVVRQPFIIREWIKVVYRLFPFRKFTATVNTKVRTFFNLRIVAMELFSNAAHF